MGWNLYKGMTASSWVLTALVIATEFSAPFKQLLTQVLWHHWIAKAVIITLVFLAVSAITKKAATEERAAWFSILANTVLIFLFFIVMYVRGA